MALSKSSLLIRDYENIRQILRDIYIFGCFSRDDFIEKNSISGRKYDKEQQRISAYLPDGFIRKRRVDKKVLLYCAYNEMDGSSNYLADTYRNKSFTALDIMAYFFVQQILNTHKEMTSAELLDELPIMNEKAVFTKDNLRIKLDELVDKGFIQIRKEGRRVLYSLSNDIWKNFSDEELLDILAFLDFIKNVSPLEMPYYFLREKLALYLRTERKKEIDEAEIFHFKHNHLFNSLDNDVLLETLRAIKAKADLRIELYGTKGNKTVIPVEIIHDSIYGRQYLYCYDLDASSPRVIRMDRISHAFSIKKQTSDERVIAHSLTGFSSECWCTSGSETELSEIIIEFCFDEEKEGYILRRISMEGHGGRLKKIGKNRYEYRLSLRDPDEMIPWIRSFGERARVISSGRKQTERKLAEDWKKALEKYDSL